PDVHRGVLGLLRRGHLNLLQRRRPVLRDLPVPRGLRRVAHGVRLRAGLAPVRGDHGGHRRAAARVPQARLLRGGATMSHPVRRRRGVRALVVAALVVLTVVFVYPLVWLLSASFKPRAEIFDNHLVPRNPTLDNYLTVWES